MTKVAVVDTSSEVRSLAVEFLLRRPLTARYPSSEADINTLRPCEDLLTYVQRFGNGFHSVEADCFETFTYIVASIIVCTTSKRLIFRQFPRDSSKWYFLGLTNYNEPFHSDNFQLSVSSNIHSETHIAQIPFFPFRTCVEFGCCS